ncbi:bifunctional 2-polyprenyl-6-hydroxyphenol methylase/3-demethylubiquinol 3-O-methyltransferase UbiG [Lichenicoccus sp.]|uniref:bifunctional 2-polyprenyl-6-hydroxyphenol methylase/3-demethylubiquinol 3-O-methyltransferase UbiG n=1 Tax=Lichenicoccus sp. TaxID=2781899 RepID=UPI003D10881E
MQPALLSPAGSVSPAEIARFGALAAQWWDPNGPMRPLHQMNPLRVRWIDQALGQRRLGGSAAPLLLDLGCGAGLASEALARRGYDVLGVDASPEAIAAAQAHGAGVARLHYRCATAEALVAEGRHFDAVVALEIIEHVTDPAAFVALLARLLTPSGGAIVISTLNRTWRSLAAAKIGAEYVLRLLPAGTHDWRKFVTPAELGRYGSQSGLRIARASGMVPLPGGWRESRDMAVNYIALLSRQ